MADEKVVENKERVTMKVIGETVELHHNTKTLDGDLWFDTTFDFTNVSHAQLLKWAADGRKIAWRATAGVKKLTSAEVVAKNLQVMTVDCSKTIERVKHVETAEEKEMKDVIKALLAGQNGKKMDMKTMLARVKELQDAQMEEGEDATQEDPTK
jgi:hypothetical protein